jgi:hypothetical protein
LALSCPRAKLRRWYDVLTQIEEADINGDGHIKFEEFVKLFDQHHLEEDNLQLAELKEDVGGSEDGFTNSDSALVTLEEEYTD